MKTLKDVHFRLFDDSIELSRVNDLLCAVYELLSPLIQSTSLTKMDMFDLVRRKDMISTTLSTAIDHLHDITQGIDEFSESLYLEEKLSTEAE